MSMPRSKVDPHQRLTALQIAAIEHAVFRLGPCEISTITRAAHAMCGNEHLSVEHVRAHLVGSRSYHNDGEGWYWASDRVPPNPAADDAPATVRTYDDFLQQLLNHISGPTFTAAEAKAIRIGGASLRVLIRRGDITHPTPSTYAFTCRSSFHAVQPR